VFGIEFKESQLKSSIRLGFKLLMIKSGSSSVAERQLPKLNVAGSIPVSRSIESIVYEEASNSCSSPVLAPIPAAAPIVFTNLRTNHPRHLWALI
jgi:hypothetical protein